MLRVLTIQLVLTNLAHLKKVVWLIVSHWSLLKLPIEVWVILYDLLIYYNVLCKYLSVVDSDWMHLLFILATNNSANSLGNIISKLLIDLNHLFSLVLLSLYVSRAKWLVGLPFLLVFLCDFQI